MTNPVSRDTTLGKFTSGSTMRHVLNMTATGSIGLIAVFLVDALNLLYISLLGQQELAAALGYASTLLFFHTSISIGLSIAATALTSRALGAGDQLQARQIAGASLIIVGAISILLMLMTLPLLRFLLQALGAQGQTLELAIRFSYWVLPSVPLLGLGMCLGAILRSAGDGKRAMYITLSAALTVAVLDPILIFGLQMGLDGAALATLVARLVLLVVGLNGVIRIHRLYITPKLAVVLRELGPFLKIGVPATLTQIATPVGNAAVTVALAKYGDQAVAGWAVIGRLIPIAFAALFALSGAIGPILGQNLGAKFYPRLRQTLLDSLQVTMIYVLVIWGLMALFRHQIATLFGAQGVGYELIVFFCLYVAASFLFNGSLFVANAAFNNLGYPLYSTMLNWGRSTLGVIPFVWLGGEWYGAIGVLAGYGLGVIFFGLAGVWLCFRVIGKLEQQ